MPDNSLVELALQFGEPHTNGATPVAVRCDQTGGSAQTTFTNPITDKGLSEIRWYLEEYWKWPVKEERERAARVIAGLNEMGRALFNAIFDNAQAMRVYEQFLNAAATARVLTIEAPTADLARLPWELLADTQGHLANKRTPISIRRKTQLEHVPPVREFSLPLRALMVIARPEGAGFLDPRSDARGVLDALKPLMDQGRVTVDFLRPPTLKALDDTLRAAEDAGHPYHIVNFDGHGVWHPHTGLGQLAFERDDCSLDLVDANRLGALLMECGVPLMVLSACQTAQGDAANPFSSIAARLIQSGVGSVLSMSHSVLVATTARFMEAFYSALVRGHTLGRATDEARRALIQDTRRHTLDRGDAFEVIELHDWFLPVLYQQQQDSAPFARSSTSPILQASASPSPLFDVPPEPLHGFVGRARELLAVERAFRAHGVVVFHGWGGTGKTALAAEAARWLTRTGLFKRAVFLSFEFCQSAEWALAQAGRALVDENFNVADGDPVERVAAALRAQPALIIFDNFESALGREPQLPPDDLPRVLAAAKRWAQCGGSRLLITTRDTDFGDPAFAPGKHTAHHEMKGLARADALDLTAEILKNNGLQREDYPRADLEQLLDKLSGHPLSLELVLPHLRQHTAAQLCEEFDDLLATFSVGQGTARNESLEASLEFSLRRLSAEARARLPALGVFAGGALEDDLLAITEIPEAEWPALKTELARAALIAIEDLPGVNFPFLRFHPTLADYLARELTTHLPLTTYQSLLARYSQRYAAAADYYYHTDSTNPHQVRAIVLRELPNLRRALRHLLSAGEVDTAVDMATSIARFLDVFGRWRERERMMEEVKGKVQGTRPKDEGGRQAAGDGLSSTVHRPLTKAQYLLASREGETLLQQGRAREAEAVFRNLLARVDGATYPAGYDRCLTLGWLGRCLSTQGRPGEAERCYRQALTALAALEQSESVQRMAGAAHTDLADVLTDMGRYAEARAEYEASLQVKKQIGGEERGIAVVQGQLGTLAMLEGDLKEAHRRFTEALQAFRALGETQGEAIGWHQLGMVAQKAAQRAPAADRPALWEEATRCYKESLVLKERMGDKAEAAKSCNQLAMVAQAAGRPEEAERWYLRAIELGEELKYFGELGKWHNNLADLLLAQGRLDEAERHAHRAREIKETLDLSSEPWMTYNTLALIAAQRGKPEEARGWRRKEQETRLAFESQSDANTNSPNIRAQVEQWHSVIEGVVSACHGDAQASNKLEPFLQEMGAKADWQNLIPALRRVMQGEHGLELFDGLDDLDSAIVRRILVLLIKASLQSPPQAPQSASPSPGGRLVPRSEAERGGDRGEGESQNEDEGLTLDQLFQLVARAVRGDRALAQQLFPAMQQLASSPAQPPALRALGDVFARLLIGERTPSLAALPPELAEAVREMLKQL